MHPQPQGWGPAPPHSCCFLDQGSQGSDSDKQMTTICKRLCTLVPSSETRKAPLLWGMTRFIPTDWETKDEDQTLNRHPHMLLSLRHTWLTASQIWFSPPLPSVDFDPLKNINSFKRKEILCFYFKSSAFFKLYDSHYFWPINLVEKKRKWYSLWNYKP